MQKHKILLDHISKGLSIEIYAIIADTLFKVNDAAENNEAEYQLIEGCFYQYKISEGHSLETSQVIEVSNFNITEGRISPNFHVGTLSIPILKNGIKKGELKLEVQSIKTSYRKDYRFMLESITKYASDLILQTNSPVNQTFEVNRETSSKTLYQQFCFVKSIIETQNFEIAIQQIIKDPVTLWSSNIEHKDVRSLKKLTSKDLRRLIHSQNRVSLPPNHNLRHHGLQSIAINIPTSVKEETVDTPENRFIKYVLEIFLFFCEEIQLKSKNGSRLNKEAKTISNKLENHLQHNLFKEVSKLTSIILNSPVLQKKAGYREILKAKLMFDLSAKLVWTGGEDVYGAGSKHVAKLYEYWLFFQLIDAIKTTFKIESEEYKKLIGKTQDQLGLLLKQGTQIALNGSYISKERELSIQFSYNKTFSKNNDLSKEGSWTLNMDPDYTLSIWPKEMSIQEAERIEQIVHIHFDAKYKVHNKQDNSMFKNEDVFKMHAYKDAIRRTGGAYILYPGTDDTPTNFRGFHEILPGLGAFAIRPSEVNSGIGHLIAFIISVKDHFLNRATQREHIAVKRYEIHKNKRKDSDVVNEPMPEYLTKDKKLIPDEVSVIIGYAQSKEQLNWIEKEGLYNVRTGVSKGAKNLNTRGAIYLTTEFAGANYILLRTSKDIYLTRMMTIKYKEDEEQKRYLGPQIVSRKELLELGYPPENNPQKELAKADTNYLLYEIEETSKELFGNQSWDHRQLEEQLSSRKATDPYAVKLSELMKTVVK
jgi:predicted component of viral defense system (DUF524 family)